MSNPTWSSETGYPDAPPLTAMGLLRALLRGIPLALVIVICLTLMLVLRIIERPLFGEARPLTPYITRFVCRSAFVLMGIRFRTRGMPMKEAGAVVANHSSWLDIFALNAPQRIYFVSKSEVAGWPGIGTLAKATGTVFINRRREEAQSQTRVFQERLGAGHKLLFFPEGTSTDGQRVLPFKPTLFQAFFDEALREQMHIQPVTVIYHAPKGAEPRAYGWWGDMDFGSHLLQVLAAPRQGAVDVVFHPPVRVADFANRKQLAAHLYEVVRSAHPKELAKAQD